MINVFKNRNFHFQASLLLYHTLKGVEDAITSADEKCQEIIPSTKS